MEVRLSPEQEQDAVDALTTLSWSTEENAGSIAVAERLNVTSAEAEMIVSDLRNRRIVKHSVQIRNGGASGFSPRRWERDEMPTTLEIITLLINLGETTLDESRQRLAQQYYSVIDEGAANVMLHELRDRGILSTQSCSGSAER